MNKWTHITEKLPEFSGRYIVAYTSTAEIAIAYFSDIDNCFYHEWTKTELHNNISYFQTVTHWMSLPKKPVNPLPK